MRHARNTLFASALAAVLAASTGCHDVGSVTLLAADQIAAPGQTIRIQARLVRTGWGRWFPPPSPPPVMIYRNNELLEEIRPVGANVAATEVRLETVGENVIDAIYQPRPRRPPLQATCHAYCWDATRVAVAVDLDRVVNSPTRFDRLTTDVPLGEVRDDAAEVLGALARDYYVCYLTELPLEAKEQVRGWLRAHDLPTGPIFTWDRGRAARLRKGNQAEAVGQLRERLPTLLIGVGDGQDDLAAFARNGMLAIVINYAGGLRPAGDVPRFDNWRAAWQFFNLDANRPILTDPRRMLDLHYQGGHYLGGP